jgi:DNA-binding MurR/RpiR family transcriptional regulator
MLFEERIQKFEYKLNDTDDQIIEYIVKNKKEVVNISIQKLAAESFTVPNTITRLSKKLGYDGYSQLKNSLKEEVQTEKSEEENSLHYNIAQTFKLIDEEKFELVCKMIFEAKRIFIFGVGDTAPFCEMMVKNLKIAGRSSEFHLHRHEMINEMNHLKHKAVFFFISLSGETSQVLEAAQLAKNKNCDVISLTHLSNNSLKNIADVNLYCYSPEQRLNEYNITDKTPLMMVLRVLSEHYWNYNK